MKFSENSFPGLVAILYVGIGSAAYSVAGWLGALTLKVNDPGYDPDGAATIGLIGGGIVSVSLALYALDRSIPVSQLEHPTVAGSFPCQLLKLLTSMLLGYGVTCGLEKFGALDRAPMSLEKTTFSFLLGGGELVLLFGLFIACCLIPVVRVFEKSNEDVVYEKLSVNDESDQDTLETRSPIHFSEAMFQSAGADSDEEVGHSTLPELGSRLPKNKEYRLA